MARFKYVLVLAVVLALLVFASTASAAAPSTGNAHFVKVSIGLSGSSLLANFKEAGLSSGSTETITLSASQFVTYECVNGGGKNPSASNKHSFVSDTFVSGNFTADRNGNIVGSLTLPVAADTSSCPPGQTDTLVSVTYSNIMLVDSTSGATFSYSGSITYTNPSAPPVR